MSRTRARATEQGDLAVPPTCWRDRCLRSLRGKLHFAPVPRCRHLVLTRPMAAKQEGLAMLSSRGCRRPRHGDVEPSRSRPGCNDLVMPVLLRLKDSPSRTARPDALLIGIRRAHHPDPAVGYCIRMAGEAYALVSIGLVSFAPWAVRAGAARGISGGRHARGALAGCRSFAYGDTRCCCRRWRARAGAIGLMRSAVRLGCSSHWSCSTTGRTR